MANCQYSHVQVRYLCVCVSLSLSLSLCFSVSLSISLERSRGRPGATKVLFIVLNQIRVVSIMVHRFFSCIISRYSLSCLFFLYSPLPPHSLLLIVLSLCLSHWSFTPLSSFPSLSLSPVSWCLHWQLHWRLWALLSSFCHGTKLCGNGWARQGLSVFLVSFKGSEQPRYMQHTASLSFKKCLCVLRWWWWHFSFLEQMKLSLYFRGLRYWVGLQQTMPVWELTGSKWCVSLSKFLRPSGLWSWLQRPCKQFRPIIPQRWVNEWRWLVSCLVRKQLFIHKTNISTLSADKGKIL